MRAKEIEETFLAKVFYSMRPLHIKEVALKLQAVPTKKPLRSKTMLRAREVLESLHAQCWDLLNEKHSSLLSADRSVISVYEALPCLVLAKVARRDKNVHNVVYSLQSLPNTQLTQQLAAEWAIVALCLFPKADFVEMANFNEFDSKARSGSVANRTANSTPLLSSSSPSVPPFVGVATANSRSAQHVVAAVSIAFEDYIAYSAELFDTGKIQQKYFIVETKVLLCADRNSVQPIEEDREEVVVLSNSPNLQRDGSKKAKRLRADPTLTAARVEFVVIDDD